MYYGVIVWCGFMLMLCTTSVMYYSEEYMHATQFMVREAQQRMFSGTLFAFVCRQIADEQAIREALHKTGEYTWRLRHPREHSTITCCARLTEKGYTVQLQDEQGVFFERRNLPL